MKQPSKSKRPGRPRNDGKPPRQRKPPLPWSIRPQIKQMLDDGATYAQIQLKFKRHKVTRNQIDNLKHGKMKLFKTPRPDSAQYTEETPDSVKAPGTIPEKMETALHLAVDKLAKLNKPAGDTINLLHKSAQTFKNIQAMKLVSKLGRRDAETIITLVRLFEPDATEEQCIEYYKRAEILVTNANRSE